MMIIKFFLAILSPIYRFFAGLNNWLSFWWRAFKLWPWQIKIGCLVMIGLAVLAILTVRGCRHHDPEVTVIPSVSTPAAGTQKAAPTKATQKAKLAKLPIIEPSKLEGRAKLPKMPLLPTTSGELSRLVIILDPGHGGCDSGAVWEETFAGSFFPDGQPRIRRFYESSYTYRMCWQLSEQIRKLGGTVYLTAYSSEMLKEPDRAQDQLPAPSDATYWWGGEPVNSRNLKPRRLLTGPLVKYWGATKKMAYLAIHINSGKDENGQRDLKTRGAHVRVWDNPKEPTPQLAIIIGQHLVAEGYIRETLGTNGLWSPSASVVRTKGRIGILKTGRNFIQNRMLLELAEPGSEKDSYRMRNENCRNLLLEKVLVASLKDFLASP